MSKRKQLQELWDSLTPKQRSIMFHYGNNSNIHMDWIALGPGLEDQLMEIAERCLLLTNTAEVSTFAAADVELESTKR